MMIALWTVGVVLLGLAGWLWWHLVGATLDAATVRERILALDKNAPLRAAGVEVVRFTARLDDTDVATAMPVVRIPGTGDVPPIVLVHPTPHSMATCAPVPRLRARKSRRDPTSAPSPACPAARTPSRSVRRSTCRGGGWVGGASALRGG